MRVPLFLFVAAIAGAVASVYLLGPVISGPLLLSVLCAAAALSLLIVARIRGQPAFIVIDGSNVMYWNDEVPALATVEQVVAELEGRGFTPVVWFDANVGYLVSDRYMGPERLARALGVSARRVFVAPKGTPADPLLLEGAARLQARVVTNDRFRDWVDDHPKVREPGFLVAGQIRGGALSLDLQG